MVGGLGIFTWDRNQICPVLERQCSPPQSETSVSPQLYSVFLWVSMSLWVHSILLEASVTLPFCSKVPSHQGFPGSPPDERLFCSKKRLPLAAPFLTLTHLLQPDEGSTEVGESMHLLEHSPADPVTRNIGQVSGELVAWMGRCS